MRGGFLHNTVLLGPIEAYFLGIGAEVSREHPILPGTGSPAVDLFIELGAERIVVEAELTANRIRADLCKAEALSATHLFIVTPTSRVAQSVRRVHAEVDSKWSPNRLWILPLGPALQALRNCYPLPRFSNPYCHHRKQIPSPDPGRTHQVLVGGTEAYRRAEP